MTLDPLIGLEDQAKPLRSRLLAVPALRAKYLSYVRTIAEKSLDWAKLRPVVEERRALIEKEIEADTRKLVTYEAFRDSLNSGSAQAQPGGDGRRPGSLKSFVEERRKFLLSRVDATKADAAPRPSGAN